MHTIIFTDPLSKCFPKEANLQSSVLIFDVFTRSNSVCWHNLLKTVCSKVLETTVGVCCLSQIIIFFFRATPKASKPSCLFWIISSFFRKSSMCWLTVLYLGEFLKAHHQGPARALPQGPFHQALTQTFLTSPLFHSQEVLAQRHRWWS